MVDANATWGSSFNAATAAEVIAKLGADHVAAIMAGTNPAATARSRATGWWDANDGDLFSAYTRLAQLILAGAISPATAPHALSWTCDCATCVTGRRTTGRAWT
jgi:hypothetical protein